MDPQKIFFSYSRLDGESYALRLGGDLRQHKANIWIDRLSITPGVPWDRAIEEALSSSNCVLFIATEKSTSSNNVLNEVAYALDENKKVIPLLFHQCRMPLLLRRLQHIDFTQDYDAALLRLLQTLELEQQVALPVNAGEDPRKDGKPEQRPENKTTETKANDETLPSPKKSGGHASDPANPLRAETEQAVKQKQKNRWLIGAAVFAVAVIVTVLLVNNGKPDSSTFSAIDPGKNESAAMNPVKDSDKNTVTANRDGKTDSRDRTTAGQDQSGNPYERNTTTSFSIISPAEKTVIHYPRTTTVIWTEVKGATGYILQVEIGGSPVFENAGEFRSWHSYKTNETSFTYQGVGYQVHRFKVIARQGETVLGETRWRYVSYSG